MKLSVNDTPREVKEGCTLQQLLNELELGTTGGTAAAVNGQVIPRKEWNECTLHEHDDILIIKATQGG